MDVCSLCYSCEDECPIGAIQIFNEKVLVCNLCSGDPECIKACTEKALVLDPREKNHSLVNYKNNSEGLTSSQKRFIFVKKQGMELRKKWRAKLA